MNSIERSNRALLKKVNRRLMRRARALLSQNIRRAAFRRIMQAEEAMEVAGLESFDLDEPAHHIDLTRLRVPPSMLPWAILNQEVLARRFEPTVENEFVAVLDVSRSMRYPLRQLYSDQERCALTEAQIESGKPSLMKLITGAFLAAAVESGFTVRLVTFGRNEIEEGPPLSRRLDLLGEVFEAIDRRIFRHGAHPWPELSLYEAVLKRVQRSKGVYLFVGDFIDAVYEWHDGARRGYWLRLLSLFRQWALQRPVVMVRVNHHEEVDRPQPRTEGGSELNPWKDRCDEQVEKYGHDDPLVMEEASENRDERRARLQYQQAWEGLLAPSLRAACRGYLSVTDKTRAAWLQRDLLRMWARLVEH